MTSKLSKNIFWLIFVLGLALRLVLLFPQHSGDIKNHLAWGNGFLANPKGFYNSHFLGFNDPNYPPLAIFLFSLSLKMYKELVLVINYLNTSFKFFPSYLVPYIINENAELGFLKLPGILSDIGIAVFLYSYYYKKRHSLSPFLGATLFLISPATIYLSSVWGQTESVTSLFLIASLYFRTSIFSIPLFVLALLVKQTALWVLPIYIIIWFKERDSWKNIKSTVLGFTLFIASYLPFGLGPISALKNYLTTLSGSSTVVSDAAWNLWYFLYSYPSEDSQKILGLLSVRTLSITILFLILGFLLFSLIKNYTLNKSLLYLSLWSVLVFFLQTRVHDRHLYPSLVFLLFCNLKPKPLVISFIILSTYHYLNLKWSLGLPFI